jgi:ligand-binding SRPBCC domain-containing protein
MIYQLTDRFRVAAELDKTWEFFSKAENLPEITPPSLHFKIVSPTPISLGYNSNIDYTISFAGIPIKWRTRIVDWTPPRQFIDLQIRGPYSMWHHQHTFEPVEGGVECVDRVHYKVPGGPVGRVMNALSVRGQLKEIFSFRQKAIAEKLGAVQEIEPVQIQPLR